MRKGGLDVERRIEEGLRVRLTSQGVTGVVYLEADNFDPHEYPPVTIAWAPKTLYIPSGRSTVTVLGSALTKIAKDLEQAEVHKVTADLDALLLSLTKLTSQTDMSELSVQAGQTLSETAGNAATGSEHSGQPRDSELPVRRSCDSRRGKAAGHRAVTHIDSKSDGCPRSCPAPSPDWILPFGEWIISWSAKAKISTKSWRTFESCQQTSGN